MGPNRIRNTREVSRRWGGIFQLLISAFILAGCSQATVLPTATPTPPPTQTPLPSPTPVPTETPTPSVILEEGTLPFPDRVQLARLSRLLTSVPAGYSSVVFMDISAFGNNSLLQEAVNLKELGLQGILPTAATALLDGISVAGSDSGLGPITAMDGDVDVETLIQLAGGFGVSVGGQDPESHREHRVWNLEVFGFSLAVGQADATTAVLASGSSAGIATPLKLVKNSLDSFDKLTPSLLDDPTAARLLNRLPSGFATAIVPECADLTELAQVIDIPGCGGAAISAGMLKEDSVVIFGLVLFQDESSATEGQKVTLQRIQEQGRLPFGTVTAGQEEELVWIRVIVDSDQLSQGLKAFSLASP